MFHSFSQDSRNFEKQGLVKKEDFELELIIKEIQRENYEKMDSKTFSSEIGSNQENENFLQDRSEHSHHPRRPFEVLLEAEAQRFPPQHSVRLEELVDFDDDLRNPEEGGFADEIFHSNHKRREALAGFRSESKHMSEIREENSHFYSESKKKHSRGK